MPYKEKNVFVTKHLCSGTLNFEMFSTRVRACWTSGGKMEMHSILNLFLFRSFEIVSTQIVEMFGFSPKIFNWVLEIHFKIQRTIHFGLSGTNLKLILISIFL